jgi:ammonia channel protein AmtB
MQKHFLATPRPKLTALQMIFVPLWLTFSYTIGAFSIWGGGFLFQRGVIDYCGGYVIHVSSGTAGFVGAWWIGPRLQRDRENFKPNNTLLALVGAGILWTGWAGFNGGGPYSASPDAGAAVLNTNITTAVSLLVWTSLDIIFFKKPAVVGAIQGMITGLVAITPAAGKSIDGLPTCMVPLLTSFRCRCWLGSHCHWNLLRIHPLGDDEHPRQDGILPRC